MGAKARINRATLPPTADLRASWAEFSESVTWPGLQARLSQFGTLLAEIGLDEVEQYIGSYLGRANQRA